MFQFFFNLNESVPSITDWIQAISGIVGLIYLIRTFRKQALATEYQARATEIQANATELQAKATELQAEVTLIAKEEYLDKIKPKLKYELKYHAANRGSVTYSTINQPAFEVCFENLSNKGVSFTRARFGTPIKGGLYPETEVVFNFTIDPSHDEVIEDKQKYNNVRIAFQVKFEDSIGNQYREVISNYKQESRFYIVESGRTLKSSK